MDTETQTEEINTPVRGRHRNDGHAGSSSFVLGPRDSLVGKLSFEGEARIEGSVEGELQIGGDVYVERAATVKARIEGQNVTIRGTVEGDVVARQKLTLSGSGHVSGNVQIQSLSIDDGAILNGNVSMQRPQPG